MIDVTVQGVPKAQPRPRAFARRFGDKVSARMYDAGTADEWKRSIVMAVRPLMPSAPMGGAVRVDIDFYFPRPRALMRRCDPDGPVLHTCKPDRDNCEKAVLDCLTRLGIFRDDAQVCAGEVRKWYAPKAGLPGARIQIQEIP